MRTREIGFTIYSGTTQWPSLKSESLQLLLSLSLLSFFVSSSWDEKDGEEASTSLVSRILGLLCGYDLATRFQQGKPFPKAS